MSDNVNDSYLSRATGLARQRTAAGLSALAMAFAAPAAAQEVYQEQGGLLVIELESAEPGGDWALEDAVAGHTGDGYLRWDGPNLFHSPGSGTFGFAFDIHSPGVYQFRIRNYHDHPDPTEENDVWVRLDGGTWIKAFSHTAGSWTWATNHELSPTNKPPASYDLTAGRHTLEFSGRSHGFHMDRFHLYLPTAPGQQDPSQPQSPTLTSNQRPVARVRLDPPVIPSTSGAPTVVTLDGTASFDPDPGQNLSFTWYVRGGRFVEGTNRTSPVARVEYARPIGAIPVRLTVQDDAAEPLVDSTHGVINARNELATQGGGNGLVRGEPAVWHTVEVLFEGPTTNELASDPNPFTDYRLDVTFRSPSGEQIVVPGFYDGDGEGGGSGNVWKVRFTPDQAGLWRYRASFRFGQYAALVNTPGIGVPTHFDGARGTIAVIDRDPNAEGFLARGRLDYVGEHYLRFRDGGYFIKGGTNSPENLLGYLGFDDIQDAGGGGILHQYGPHEQDWEPGDPYFVSNTTNITSRCLIGALNYLSREHVNSVYFLPMNLGGDGQETYPFVGYENTQFNKRHYDISRLHQWAQVFDHAQRKGILLHFVLGETEHANEMWLDAGALGVTRRLFYREMIARFGHGLGVKWNLCEENDFSIESLENFAGLIDMLDPYGHPIAVHTHPDNFQDYEQIVGNPLFTATSIQYSPDMGNSHVEEWRDRSAAAGRKWIVDMDEQGPWNTGLNDQNAEDLRKRILYDVYFSGGQVEWYAGYHDLPLGGDLKIEDFRTRQDMWRFMWYARRFMEEHLPFWEMEPADELVQGENQEYGGAQVFAKQGEVYAIYLPNAAPSGNLNLQGVSGTFRARWYDPRTGEFAGEERVLQGGTNPGLGATPTLSGQDWVWLVERIGG